MTATLDTDLRYGTKTAVRGVGYIRVSSEHGRAGKDNFHSPTQQREAIESFAAARGIELVDFVEAIDQTSKKGQNFDTDEFQGLKAKIGRGDAIVVYKFDRFGRDLRCAVSNIEEIESNGGSVLSATETNSNDSSGRLARDIFFSFAQYQLNRITEGWNDIHDRLHAAGVHHGLAPLGYDKPKVNGKPQPLVPNDDAWIVLYVFEQRREGVPFGDISHDLREKTGRFFHQNYLRKIIRNRAYLGEVRRASRPVRADAHPPLVTRSLFEACQQPVRQTTAPRDHLLTGIVFCQGCGHRMQSRMVKATTPTGQRRIYCCQGTKNEKGRHHCPDCTAMTADILEDFIVAEFFREFAARRAYRPAHASVDLFDLERAVTEAEDDVRAWMQNTVAQRASAGLWEEELNRRTRVVSECQKALRAAHKAAGTGSLPSLQTIEPAWSAWGNTERRKVLTQAINGIVIGPGRRGVKGLQTERVTITWA